MSFVRTDPLLLIAVAATASTAVIMAAGDAIARIIRATKGEDRRKP